MTSNFSSIPHSYTSTSLVGSASFSKPAVAAATASAGTVSTTSATSPQIAPLQQQQPQQTPSNYFPSQALSSHNPNQSPILTSAIPSQQPTQSSLQHQQQQQQQPQSSSSSSSHLSSQPASSPPSFTNLQSSNAFSHHQQASSTQQNSIGKQAHIHSQQPQQATTTITSSKNQSQATISVPTQIQTTSLLNHYQIGDNHRSFNLSGIPSTSETHLKTTRSTSKTSSTTGPSQMMQARSNSSKRKQDTENSIDHLRFKTKDLFAAAASSSAGFSLASITSQSPSLYQQHSFMNKSLLQQPSSMQTSLLQQTAQQTPVQTLSQASHVQSTAIHTNPSIRVVKSSENPQKYRVECASPLTETLHELKSTLEAELVLSNVLPTINLITSLEEKLASLKSQLATLITDQHNNNNQTHESKLKYQPHHQRTPVIGKTSILVNPNNANTATTTTTTTTTTSTTGNGTQYNFPNTSSNNTLNSQPNLDHVPERASSAKKDPPIYKFALNPASSATEIPPTNQHSINFEKKPQSIHNNPQIPTTTTAQITTISSASTRARSEQPQSSLTQYTSPSAITASNQYSSLFPSNRNPSESPKKTTQLQQQLLPQQHLYQPQQQQQQQQPRISSTQYTTPSSLFCGGSVTPIVMATTQQKKTADFLEKRKSSQQQQRSLNTQFETGIPQSQKLVKKLTQISKTDQNPPTNNNNSNQSLIPLKIASEEPILATNTTTTSALPKSRESAANNLHALSTASTSISTNYSSIKDTNDQVKRSKKDSESDFYQQKYSATVTNPSSTTITPFPSHPQQQQQQQQQQAQSQQQHQPQSQQQQRLKQHSPNESLSNIFPIAKPINLQTQQESQEIILSQIQSPILSKIPIVPATTTSNLFNLYSNRSALNSNPTPIVSDQPHNPYLQNESEQQKQQEQHHQLIPQHLPKSSTTAQAAQAKQNLKEYAPTTQIQSMNQSNQYNNSKGQSEMKPPPSVQSSNYPRFQDHSISPTGASEPIKIEITASPKGKKDISKFQNHQQLQSTTTNYSTILQQPSHRQEQQPYQQQQYSTNNPIQESPHIPSAANSKIKGTQSNYHSYSSQKPTSLSNPTSTSIKPEQSAYSSLKQSSSSIYQSNSFQTPYDPQTYSLANFQIGIKLGSGKFADVFAAIDKKSGFRVALKRIKKSTIKEFELQVDVINEIRIQSQLQHPNIVSLYGFFGTSDSIYLIEELACGHELFKELKSQPYKKFTELQASIYARQIIDALLYMHSKNVLHRDIKPENIIVVADGQVKLCDFGYATTVMKSEMRKTFCGTLDYVSPEMVQGKAYDFSVDIWSLGVLVFEMLFGVAPFFGKNQDAVFNQIVHGELHFPGPTSIDAADFISRILKREPSKRMTLHECLAHPFIHYETSKQNTRNPNSDGEYSLIDKQDLLKIL